MQIRNMAPKRPTVSHVTAKLPFGEIQMYGVKGGYQPIP
jgi:hypothetical protein